jgi:AraC-like DNA-binding protein
VPSYREVAPPAGFGSHVVCTWTLDVDGAPHRQAVLPDGCVDLLWLGGAPPRVVGPMTRTEVTAIPAGASAVGIRLAPGRAAAVLGMPVAELVDREVPVAELWRGVIAEPIDPALPAEARRRIAEQRLLERGLGRTGRGVRLDPAVDAAVAWLAQHPSGRVRDVARAVGLSARQLQRRFAPAVGYGPKTFHRIARLQRLLALAAQRHGLAELAIDAGYADQAHMTREVRELAGTTPTAIVGAVPSALAMSDLF